MAATLATLTARAQARADQENSQFVKNWTDLINNAYKRLYNKLLQLHEEYFISSTNISLVGSQEDYTLPSNFFKLKAVDLLLGGNANSVITVYPFQWEERNRIRQNNLVAQTAIGCSYRYQLRGANTLKILPVPAVGTDVLRVWFIPSITELVNQTDVVVTDPLFDEYIEVYAAIQSYEKEESVPEGLKSDFQELEAMVMRTASARKEDQPRRIAVVVDDYGGLEGVWGVSDYSNRENS